MIRKLSKIIIELDFSGRSVDEMKLESMPSTSRAASGVVGVKMIITEVANCGARGEKEITSINQLYSRCLLSEE